MSRAAKGPFGTDERARFLDLIRAGFGIHGSLAQLKTHYRRYEQTLRRYADFRRALRHAREYQHEHLVTLRYAAAVEGDGRAQEYLISRHDRGRALAAEMKLRREELAGRQTGTAAAADDDRALREFLHPDPDPPESGGPRSGDPA